MLSLFTPKASFHHACCTGDLNAARACWGAERDAIGDLNANAFGYFSDEPLLCSLARDTQCVSFDNLRAPAICAFLVAEGAADPNRANSQGETPLALATIAMLDYLVADLRLDPVAAMLGGATVDHPATATYIVHNCVRRSCLASLARLVDANRPTFSVAAARVPCLHYLVGLVRPEPQQLRAAFVLLDAVGVDPLERDAEGRTVAELPTTSPALRELLADAPLHFHQMAAAASLALHGRVGANSPLHLLDAELLRDFVLPLLATATASSLYYVREARLDALVEAEGLVIDDDARNDYLRHGAPLDPPHLRFQHLLRLLPRELDARLRAAATDDEEEGLRAFIRARVAPIEDFAHPFSPDVQLTALASLEAVLYA